MGRPARLPRRGMRVLARVQRRRVGPPRPERMMSGADHEAEAVIVTTSPAWCTPG
jgi:hypothetical protein